MNRNVNVFIAVVLCMGLCGGLIWLHTANDGKLGWNIQDFYEGASESSSGAAYTNATFSGSADGGSLSMPVMSSRGLRRSATSHVGVYSQPIANSQSPLTSSPATAGGAMYATSSQTYKSFGGGMSVGVNTGGSVRNAANVSSLITYSSAGASLSVPELSTVNSQLSTNNNADMSAVVASAPAMGGISVYGGISTVNNQLSTALSTDYVGCFGAYGISSGRKRSSTMGGLLNDWVAGLIGGEGWMYEDEGINYFYESKLRALYEAAIENGDLPVGVTWEEFLDWFKGQSSTYKFPLPDGAWFLIILALCYSLSIYIRKRTQLSINK